MRLFHGSNMRVDAIDLSRSKKFKDFGQAFYLSEDEVQAYELAESRADFMGGEPVVNEFEFDEQMAAGLGLKVKRFEHYSLDWAQFTWNNRDEGQDYHHEYDVVYGPIMNDTVGFQMREFKKKHRDLGLFLKGIKYEKGETFQWAFCTEKAIKCLRRI